MNYRILKNQDGTFQPEFYEVDKRRWIAVATKSEIDNGYQYYSPVTTDTIEAAKELALATPNREEIVYFSDEAPTTIDWDYRRYEIAKDIVASCNANSHEDITNWDRNSMMINALEQADALIELLKGDAK